MRDPNYNNGEPSLYVLQQIVAYNFWQQLLQIQQPESSSFFDHYNHHHPHDNDARTRPRLNCHGDPPSAAAPAAAAGAMPTTTPMLFPLSPPSSQTKKKLSLIHRIPYFRLRYQDDDKDWMDLIDDGDLMEALRRPPMGGLKIRVVQNKASSTHRRHRHHDKTRHPNKKESHHHSSNTTHSQEQEQHGDEKVKNKNKDAGNNNNNKNNNNKNNNNKNKSPRQSPRENSLNRGTADRVKELIGSLQEQEDRTWSTQQNTISPNTVIQGIPIEAGATVAVMGEEVLVGRPTTSGRTTRTRRIATSGLISSPRLSQSSSRTMTASFAQQQQDYDQQEQQRGVHKMRMRTPIVMPQQRSQQIEQTPPWSPDNKNSKMNRQPHPWITPSTTRTTTTTIMGIPIKPEDSGSNTAAIAGMRGHDGRREVKEEDGDEKFAVTLPRQCPRRSVSHSRHSPYLLQQPPPQQTHLPVVQGYYSTPTTVDLPLPQTTTSTRPTTTRLTQIELSLHRRRKCEKRERA